MEPLYRIVFAGELAPGKSVSEIVESFSARFRVSEDKARNMVLGGQRLVLKHDLDLRRAARYRDALEDTGLVVVLEAQDPPPGSPPPGSPPTGSGRAVDVDLRQGDTRVPEGRILHSELFVSEMAADSGPPPAAEPARTTAGPGIADSGHCPKCGSSQVSSLTGVCQDCGVVVERYLARLAGQVGGPRADPYAPPRADLSAPRVGNDSATVREPCAVAAGRGWGWIAEAWPLFKDRPLAWIGAVLALMIVYILLSLLPFVGGLISTVLGPAFTGGLAIGAHVQYGGGRFEVNHLFAGLIRNPNGLLLLGAAYLGLLLIFGLIVGLSMALVFGMSGGFSLFEGAGGLEPAQFEQMGTMTVLAVLIALLFSIPMAMAVFFAPYLVALNKVPVLQSFKLSFQGCWRNILPFLVFSLAVVGLSIASLLTLGLAFLVVLPVLTIAIYIAYRDIYYGSQGD
jgi:hypothetical protein